MISCKSNVLSSLTITNCPSLTFIEASCQKGIQPNISLDNLPSLRYIRIPENNPNFFGQKRVNFPKLQTIERLEKDDKLSTLKDFPSETAERKSEKSPKPKSSKKQKIKEKKLKNKINPKPQKAKIPKNPTELNQQKKEQLYNQTLTPLKNDKSKDLGWVWLPVVIGGIAVVGGIFAIIIKRKKKDKEE